MKSALEEAPQLMSPCPGAARLAGGALLQPCSNQEVSSILILTTVLSAVRVFPFQHILCVTSNPSNLYFFSTCYGRLTLWMKSLEDAQVVLRCAFVRKKQFQANLKGFLFASHFRFQTDHIGMILAKAEALFHLTEFEQALLHFHNGLVCFCHSPAVAT